ncbi:hypothetical protein K5X85_29095 [Streptomyces sp. A144]|uniref:hypothetical protein n=1 Tax=Streptomyces sp. A144 TaxID=2871487 RepID=UPI001CBE94DE|nr:hypothetical protein [Streptomyces sp. A144]UAX56786.1 hypothetical protein K5X85_29095 [Streptomyces sp. A144]
MFPPQRPPAANGPGHCPRCLASVIWCLTDARRVPQAVDPDRDPSGRVAVRVDGTGRYLCRQLSKERPSPEGGEHLHVAHVANCPAAAPRTTSRRLSSSRARTGVRPVRWQR